MMIILLMQCMFMQNIYCSDWNEYMLNVLDGDMFICVSVDSKKNLHTNLVNVALPTKPRNTCYLHQILNIEVGARIMLTTNADVSDGLTNGAIGKVNNV